MWTSTKSAFLSLICTRALIGIAIFVAVALPFVLSGGPVNGLSVGFYGSNPEAGMLYVGMPAETVFALYICAYACFVPVMIVLFSLDLLLRNIKKDQVFLRVNVKYLRIISWCCFAIAIIMLCGWPFISYAFIAIAAAAAFFGLLVRVVKNVIDAACEIKDENDYTI